jgi:hexosaminidase
MHFQRIGPTLLAFCSLALSTFAFSQSPLKLIPMPREVRATSDQKLPHGVRIVCKGCAANAEDQFAADDLALTLEARHIPVTGAGGFVIELTRLSAHPVADFTDEMKPEGYVIATNSEGLTVTGATAAGVFYGAQTVKQLIGGSGIGAVLHAADIRDWPAMKYRGLDDDLSRGPITTLEFQKRLIRTLAAYKINLYSPYFEHTQQYASNPLMSPPGSVTADEAEQLVAYARPYHITIVPEQEAFGHLHHNLTWEQYQPLAETPHGEVLAPGQPGSLTLIKQMFTELAAVYPGPFLHIGADETVDLGLGQTKADVDSKGLAPVYLDFLERIDTALEPLHRRLLFWGDIAQDAPDLLKTVPQSFKDSTIAIAWVYSVEPRGFDRFLTPFTQAGFETWVAPSVNNYRKVYPDDNVTLPNIERFTADGQRLGSTGQLNTIWNDDGEGLFNQDWYGILFGAAAAWQKGDSSIAQFQDSYAQVFHGDMTGDLNEAQKEMMLAHALLKDEAKVGDGTNSIFWLDPMSADGLRIGNQVRPFAHELRLHAERALTLIAEARAAAPPVAVAASTTAATYDPANSYRSNPTALRETEAIDALELGVRRMDFIGLKFQLSDEIAEGYQRAYAMQNTTDKKQRSDVSRELSEINGVNGRIHDIIDTYSLLRDLYEQAWYRSNRAYGLRPVLEHYDYTVGIWLQRSDKLRSAQRQWSDIRTLPTAGDMGLPSPPTMPQMIPPATPPSTTPATTPPTQPTIPPPPAGSR